VTSVVPVLVYHLGEAHAEQTDTLGGKGASLVRMAELGLPVPPAFIVSTSVSRQYDDGGLNDDAWAEIEAGIEGLEQDCGRGFGDTAAPLLVSVRSGAAVSMPGMMDTILNIGLCESTIDGFARYLGEPAAAWEAYARVVQSYGESVHGIAPAKFGSLQPDPDPDREAAARARVDAALELIDKVSGQPFPHDPRRQLRDAVDAVLRSWMSPRAVRYRRFSGISGDLGTAVIVQSMVFGNLAEESGTGVAFTRDPATGAPGTYGDFLRRAQGDDVVGGEANVDDISQLAMIAPEAARRLKRAGDLLERSYKDLCDIEFTVERGHLWILQARRGQRSAAAAIRIALDLADEGLIDDVEMMRRIPPEAFIRVLDPIIDPDAPRTVIGRGVAASPGAAVGTVALDPLEAEERAGAGEHPILFRETTSPLDIAGMLAACGIVTARGGRTSHAAVVARGISRPAVCGVGTLTFGDGCAHLGDQVLSSSDTVSIDGSAGTIYAGALSLVVPTLDRRVELFLADCDAGRRLELLSTGGPASWADAELDPALEVVSEVNQIDAASGERVVIAPLGESAPAFVKQAADRLSDRKLILRVPDPWPPSLRELPPCSWVAVAASERTRLAARFLAATIDCEPA
jgi:pyruvate,orthophosphate dikinase